VPERNVELAAEFVPEILEREGEAWARAASSSMAPLIQVGDELRVVPLDPALVRRGMILAYRDERRLIVHRVLANGPQGVVTKGDALAKPDGLIGWDRIVGRIVAIRTPSGRTMELDRFPRPLIDRAVSVVARLAPRNALAWKAHRLPFHLLALITR